LQQQWATDLVLPILNDLTSKGICAYWFSGFYNPSHKTYFEQMKEWIKEYDANVFYPMIIEILILQENNAKNIVVIIPNGADKDEFENNKVARRNKLNIPQDSFVILTVGSHTGLKGHNESMAFLRN
jgi:glycosyltransferase involved in cell wall biosynthesis